MVACGRAATHTASDWSTRSVGCATAVDIARKRADLPSDAQVRRAPHVAALSRLGRARNSEDPRAALGASLPGLSELSTALGLPAAAALRMPAITIR